MAEGKGATSPGNPVKNGNGAEAKSIVAHSRTGSTKLPRVFARGVVLHYRRATIELLHYHFSIWGLSDRLRALRPHGKRP